MWTSLYNQICTLYFLTARGGFEPPLMDSETIVLPLNYLALTVENITENRSQNNLFYENYPF